MTRRYFVQIAGETHALDVIRTADGDYRASSADGGQFVFHVLGRQGPLCTLASAGRVLEVQADGEVRLDGERHLATVESEHERGAARHLPSALARSKTVSAPMPGLISQVLCSGGGSVCKGDPLVVIEAMKMQNELCATHDGVVRAVHVASGDRVDRGALLLEFE
jgi:acetyl/propionyl-CoA carboxylase alpha subunit